MLSNNVLILEMQTLKCMLLQSDVTEECVSRSNVRLVCVWVFSDLGTFKDITQDKWSDLDIVLHFSRPNNTVSHCCNSAKPGVFSQPDFPLKIQPSRHIRDV